MADILDTIDGAIRDASVGNDAMRWTPEPQPEPRRSDLPPVAPGHCRVQGADGTVLYEGRYPIAHR